MPKKDSKKKTAKSTEKATSAMVAAALPPPSPYDVEFPIVAVGASAGGLQAFLELVVAIPPTPGFAMIFVLHTDGREASSLREVLAHKSKLPVEVAAEGMKIVVDHLYIPPSGHELLLEKGRFHVQQRDRERPTVTIDNTFRAVANDQGGRAIGVVLSGTLSDGAFGIKAIKNEGGVTFAQDATSQSHEMPDNAVLTGSVDFVLPPKEIASELVRIARHPYMASAVRPPAFVDNDFARIFEILNRAHAVDFAHYKPSTLERRIRRRMALNRIESVDRYVELLRQKPAELEALYNDVLIRVTGFFRDPDVFTALCGTILPAILRERAPRDSIRVWVPGCATGEEVYSLAICINEAIGDGGFSCPVQIFGTDINEQAIDRARAGVYRNDIESEVSAERLRRHFVPVENGYRVSKSLRDCCIFARQNVTKDPPFSRLDLISCRNLMIYLGPVLQRRVMAIFHYALRPNGLLLLGSSETIGAFGDLFSSVDRKHRIYMKRTGRTPAAVGVEAPAQRPVPESTRMEDEGTTTTNVFRDADRVLLARFTPPGVLINEQMDILQFRGRTSPFLEPAPGAASLNLLKMAREGILAELRAAIHAARKKEGAVRREGLRVATDGSAITVNIEVLPFRPTSGEMCYLVLFEEAQPDKKGKGKAKKADPEQEASQRQRLKRELESTREYLQSIIEEQEAMNEELRSANEEIQSSNEELQSTNEELETAKEELQSSNEELTTLNEELENRHAALAEANNDLINVITSVESPILMLDSEMRIRRMNPGAQRLLNLIPSDVGRPVRELKMTLKTDGLEEAITGVVQNLEVRELRVQHQSGQWYSLRIRPYKTIDNKIEGTVLVLVDERRGPP